MTPATYFGIDVAKDLLNLAERPSGHPLNGCPRRGRQAGRLALATCVRKLLTILNAAVAKDLSTVHHSPLSRPCTSCLAA
jgi:hypothetical protein